MEPIDSHLPKDQNSTLNQEVVQSNVDEVRASIRSRGNWFFWIAGLSLINSFLTAKGGAFIVGLAFSQFVDAVVVELTGEINYVVSLVCPAIFAMFGYFAYRLNRWAFIVGGIVYLLDGLLYLYFQEWFAAAFHMYVLYILYKGYAEITEFEQEVRNLN